MSGKNAVGVFLAGAGIGAIIALLFAPQSGEDTRKYLGRKAEDGTDFVASKAKELQRQAEDFVDKSRKTADKIAERGRAVAEKVVSL